MGFPTFALLLALVPLAASHGDHGDYSRPSRRPSRPSSGSSSRDFSCKNLPEEVQGYHADHQARYVELERPLREGDTVIIRGKLGPGRNPQKRFYLDFARGPVRTYRTQPRTFPSTFHLSAQYDTGSLYFGRFNGKDFIDFWTLSNPFTEARFTIRVEIKEDGYAVYKDDIYLATYKSRAYTSVQVIYLENLTVDERVRCKDPECAHLSGDKLTVVIGDGKITQTRGTCPYERKF
ncbi:unnamed protein product [Caenorhabditis auriculariae]|uniref:Galectin domain-containing protein n=1 Tax=Caenorhabditis auriculariae TaxID=2777116 RepID=A0A8S1H2Q5_9PELO|nr:unnamed protein product [Caenorhabditis auriculariae]